MVGIPRAKSGTSWNRRENREGSEDIPQEKSPGHDCRPLVGVELVHVPYLAERPRHILHDLHVFERSVQRLVAASSLGLALGVFHVLGVLGVLDRLFDGFLVVPSI